MKKGLRVLAVVVLVAVMSLGVQAANLESLGPVQSTFSAAAEIRHTSSGGYDYYGYAKVGTKTLAPGWRIMRKDSSNNVEWAKGSDEFNLTFSSATTYTYTEGM